MSRGMRSHFAEDWAQKRGGAGRGLFGGKKQETEMFGLSISYKPELLLLPNRKPICLPPCVEEHIISSLELFEMKFGSGIVTSMVIESLAMNEFYVIGKNRVLTKTWNMKT